MAIPNGQALAAAAADILAACVARTGGETFLRLTLQLPLDSHIGQILLQFKTEVESRTNGAIEVQIFDSNQLYKDKDVPLAVQTGADRDGRGAADPLLSPTSRRLGIFDMPFLFNTEELVRDATANQRNPR